VWSWASSASAIAAAPGVLSDSSWACLSNAQWRSRCLCRAGVTVGAFEANVNDDLNLLYLLCNGQITVSIAILKLTEARLGAFGSPLPVGMLSRKTLSATSCEEYSLSVGNAVCLSSSSRSQNCCQRSFS